MNEIMKNELLNHRNHLNPDETYLLKDFLYQKNKRIVYSVVIPVYNQEEIIVKHINSVIKYTLLPFEIIIILDYCNDNSEKRIIDFFQNLYTENINSDLVSVLIFKQPNTPIFEASCDNIGFVFSTGKYILEIQADMEMTQPGYNIELTKPFLKMENVIAVSGRCAHNFLQEGYGCGKLGDLIEKTVDELQIKRNYFYVFETCCRGPLLLLKSKVKQLQYLDEKNFHQENADHDLMIRAYLNYGYICGYVPIDFVSKISNGTCRKIDSFKETNDLYKKLRISNQEIQGEGLISGETINKYKNNWKTRQAQIYDLSDIDLSKLVHELSI